MKHLSSLIAIAALALLGACGSGSESEAPAPTSAASEPAPMADMSDMPGDMGSTPKISEAKSAKGTGTVTAIDKAAGTITLDHGPIAEADWPAMTMAFKAAPALLDSVKVGDKVDFELELGGGSGEITAIHKK